MVKYKRETAEHKREMVKYERENPKIPMIYFITFLIFS